MNNIVLNFKFNLALVFGLAIVLTSSYIFPASAFNSLLLIIIGLLATVPVIYGTINVIKNKKISVDLLASIALLVSLINHEWESVAFINLMITCARMFGIYTETKAKNSIQSLFKLRPDKVKIKVGSSIKIIDIKDVKVDDLVIVEAGERIPIDGTIKAGAASIDQSSLTGESLPLEKKVGDQVLSSTLNLAGSLLVKTDKIGKDTTFEKIVGLMEDAQAHKVNIETFIEKFTSKYILFTFITASLVLIFSRNINLVLSILLVTCADDIAVAVPLAFWAAIAKAAKKGIVIKGGNYLEGLMRCRMLIVDKTGTLTRGRIKVNHIIAFGAPIKRILKLASIAESVSEHPIARSIVEYAYDSKVKFDIPSDFEEISGRGMKVKWHGKNLIVGNLALLKDQKIKIDNNALNQISSAESDGHNIVVVAYNKKLLGFIALGDELRYGIKSTIERLKKFGVVRVVMLTGDNEKVAKNVAREIGIAEYHANLLPKDKLNFVKKDINSSYKIAMVGDGVNDAAALALADVGIAMGAIGSDSAIEAADIALMNDEFGRIAEAVGLSKALGRIIVENFIIWAIVNSVGLILVFGKIIGPQGAAAYNFFSDFLPLINSLRIFQYRYPHLNLRSKLHF